MFLRFEVVVHDAVVVEVLEREEELVEKSLALGFRKADAANALLQAAIVGALQDKVVRVLQTRK